MEIPEDWWQMRILWLHWFSLIYTVQPLYNQYSPKCSSHGSEIFMAQCKIAVTPLLMYWSYCSLAISLQYGRCFMSSESDLHSTIIVVMLEVIFIILGRVLVRCRCEIFLTMFSTAEEKPISFRANLMLPSVTSNMINELKIHDELYLSV